LESFSINTFALVAKSLKMPKRERLLPRFNQAEYYLLRLPPRDGNLKKQVKLLKYWRRLLELGNNNCKPGNFSVLGYQHALIY